MAAKLTFVPKNFKEAREFTIGKGHRKIGPNTELVYGIDQRGSYVAATLHFSKIVKWYHDGTREVSWAGHPTALTRDRLSSLVPDHRFNIRKGEGYIDGEETLSLGWTVL